MLFHTAAIGIVHNIKDNTQKHIFENSDDIISMAVWGDLCVTAEIGPKPIISLWSSDSMEVYGNISGVL